MDKAKVAKFAIKAVIGGVTAVMIGTTIKQEKRVGELLDTYFSNKTDIGT